MKIFKRISPIQLLLTVTFFNSAIFALLTPIWQAPDEQAHFAQVQYWAERGSQPPGGSGVNNLSQEILLTETLLGVNRDKFGNNKFTHHPEFNIDYSTSTWGKFEQVILSIPQASRTTFVKQEATIYPPLFYVIAAIFYRAGYSLDIINRIYLVRLASMLMGLATVYFSFKLAQLIFGQNSLLSLTSASLVSFQPMFSFISSGVTSDNLMNLLFTILLLLCFRIIKDKKLSKKNAVLISGLVLALKLTKPHYVIALPILASIIFFYPKKAWRYFKNHYRLILSLALLVGFYRIIFSRPFNVPEVSWKTALFSPRAPQVTLIEHLIWTLRHTLAEVIPWYWGVFKWLGVTLPRLVNRILNRLLILSAVGLGVFGYRVFKLKKVGLKPKLIIFSASASAIYFFSLMLWDFLFRRYYNFSFGMQGRYYFPTLAAHMILLLVGLICIIPQSLSKLTVFWVKFLGIGMVVVNFIALHTLTTSYYDLTSFDTFFMQASQYKPVYLKYPLSLIWLGFYTLSLTLWLIKYVGFRNRQTSWP